ncbi:hypothetical protein BISA_1363 [Bifidobacterium saguini DSM 23967]|uniref:Uncharacterized protein n=1 Tax=Bifidobacterium saguini DSM 23967 TaxID=1437607 RepID=A0A087DCE8_9BIFI|nr:hypothetical protein [Bifidobacterium saguini]KFI93198.1 hypothetical protein BISA_1363 [Bifidobacterium saguini DSM 23967]
MNENRTKAIILAIACLGILLLLTVECIAMPRLGWLWVITGVIVLILLTACIIIAIRSKR